MGQVVRHVLDPVMLGEIAPEGKTLLDVGCGEGYFTRVLKAAGASRVVGADISPALIHKARAQDPDGEYEVYDIASGPLGAPGTFDAVSGCMMLMDLSDLDVAYQSIAASLTPTGQFVACMINPYYAFPVGSWRKSWRDGVHHDVDPSLSKVRRAIGLTRRILQGNKDLSLYIGNYFQTRAVRKMLGDAETLHFHKPFADYLNYAAKHGLILQRLLEPQIPEDARERYLDEPLAQALDSVPLFFVLTFTKST
jgi:2-polyprenyl-3-methyl-5-hydroxy-6-metoxy-1,4-benzoquinol methylase